MSGSSAERDSFAADSCGGPKKPVMERNKSFREISRMSPDVIKSVMKRTPAATAVATSPLPRSKDRIGVAPFTIFYNGSVVVFDLPHQKAENILKLVEGEEFDVNKTCFPRS